MKDMELKFEDKLNALLIDKKFRGFAIVEHMENFRYLPSWEDSVEFFRVQIVEETGRKVILFREIKSDEDLIKIAEVVDGVL